MLVIGYSLAEYVSLHKQSGYIFMPTRRTDLKGHPRNRFINRVKCRMILLVIYVFFPFGYLQLILLVIDFYENNSTLKVFRLKKKEKEKEPPNVLIKNTLILGLQKSENFTTTDIIHATSCDSVSIS